MFDVCSDGACRLLSGASGGQVKDRFDGRKDQVLYRGLHLSREERQWVNHYLRVADHVLFGKHPAPRVVVVDEDWQLPRRRVVIAPRKVA